MPLKSYIFALSALFIMGCSSTAFCASTKLSTTDKELLSELISLDLNDSEFECAGPGHKKLKLVGRRKGKVQDIIQRAENPRLVSILLTIALGPFGAHRLYLGTHIRVPIVYTLTLGGGLGILPAIDLIMLIIQKDLSLFRDNAKIFMWS